MLEAYKLTFVELYQDKIVQKYKYNVKTSPIDIFMQRIKTNNGLDYKCRINIQFTYL